MTHLFNSGRRCVPSLGSLALASVRHAPAIYRKNVALTYVDIYENTTVDEELMADWIRQASKLQGWVP
jgi:hypothetical protein